MAFQFPLNPLLDDMKPSATLAINERSHALIAEGQHIHKLGLGQSPFPVPERVVNALRTHAGQKDYLPVQGLLSLRTAIANHHRARGDFGGYADDIMIGPGSKELLFIIQMAHQGTLLLPSPSWVSYSPQAQLVTKTVDWIDTRASRWRLTGSALDAYCQKRPTTPKLIVLNYPNNPTGLSFDADQLAEIAEVCRTWGITVISDEIYGLVQHDGTHRSIAEFYPEGTIICSGLSKWCGAGGWRLGYACVPPQLSSLMAAMRTIASETFTSVSAPIQYAAVSAFEDHPDIVRYLEDSRRLLKSLGQWIAVQLRGAGIDVDDPDGGFYCFPSFEPLRSHLEERNIYTGEQLCNALLDDVGIACLPGSCFGRPADELTLRLSYVDFDGAAALDQLAGHSADETIEEAHLRHWCESTVTAIESMARWCTA